MNIKNIETCPLEGMRISEISHASSSRKVAGNIKRRKLLKLVGMAGIGSSVAGIANLATPKTANAMCYMNAYGYTFCDYSNYWFYQQYQGYLMWSYLQQMRLYQSYYNLYQPINGRFTLYNDSNESVAGNVVMTLVKRERIDEIEDSSAVAYDIPARESQTIEFTDGPAGQSPGQKIATIWTANSSVSRELTVG
mgnify:CR=1 FL=1